MHASIPEDFDFVPDIGLGPGFGLGLGPLYMLVLISSQFKTKHKS